MQNNCPERAIYTVSSNTVWYHKTFLTSYIFFKSMEARGSKRKRTGDVKSTLVTELYDLNNDSFNLTEDLNDANDHFVQLFKSIGERQSEIYAKSIGVDERYE